MCEFVAAYVGAEFVAVCIWSVVSLWAVFRHWFPVVTAVAVFLMEKVVSGASGALPLSYADVGLALAILVGFGDDPPRFGVRAGFHFVGDAWWIGDRKAVSGAELVLYSQQVAFHVVYGCDQSHGCNWLSIVMATFSVCPRMHAVVIGA